MDCLLQFFYFVDLNGVQISLFMLLNGMYVVQKVQPITSLVWVSYFIVSFVQGGLK